MLLVVIGERRPLSTIGVRKPRPSHLVLGGAAGIISLAFTAALVAPHGGGPGAQGFACVLALPLGERLVLWLTVAISKEVVYCGSG
jgi:hypothetical protein